MSEQTVKMPLQKLHDRVFTKKLRIKKKKLLYSKIGQTQLMSD